MMRTGKSCSRFSKTNSPSVDTSGKPRGERSPFGYGQSVATPSISSIFSMISIRIEMPMELTIFVFARFSSSRPERSRLKSLSIRPSAPVSEGP